MKAVVLAVLGCFASLTVSASTIWAETQPDTVWSFADLAREAAETHPAVIGKRLERDAALAEVDGARWQRWPLPELQASQDDGDGATVVLGLQQPLWTGGRISAGIDAAEARHDAADATIAKARQEIIQRVADSYVEVRRRQAQQEINYQNVQQHERLLGLISRRVKQEISPRVDLDLANSRLYQAANELSVTTQALQHGLTRLSELSGQPVERVTADEELAQGVPEAKDELLARALAVSPLLAGLDRERLAAEADIRSEKAAWWPMLALRLERRDSDGLKDERAMLVLQSQLGAGLSTGAQVGAAISRRDALGQERLAAIRELRSEAAEFWQQFTAARLRLENSRMYRESAATVFDSYARQYVIGQKSWLDVLNAVREASSAALTVEDAEAEMLRAALRLRLLTGHLDSWRPEPAAYPGGSHDRSQN